MQRRSNNHCSTSAHSLAQKTTIQAIEQYSGIDLSSVKVHYRSLEPQKYSAHAYTQGTNIYLAAGQEKHLGHEAWHVIQQMQGRVNTTHQCLGQHLNNNQALERDADIMSQRAINSQIIPSPLRRLNVRSPMIQRRRIPSALDNYDLTSGANSSAHNSGLETLILRSWLALTPVQKSAVLRRVLPQQETTSLSFISPHLIGLLYPRPPELSQRALLYSLAIRHEAPNLAFTPSPSELTGSTNPIDIANIRTLVNNATVVFRQILSGAHDQSIAQVFARAHVRRVKRRYQRAFNKARRLHRDNKIVTERSGYSQETGLDGFSDGSVIYLQPPIIDNPSNAESVITFIHEAIHAGTRRITDELGYITQGSFTRLATAGKLLTAAYYEVVPRRILGASHSFTGLRFIPAINTAQAPALTTTELALKAVYDLFNKAWSTGTDLHDFYVEVFHTPTLWSNTNLGTRFSGAQNNSSFATTLPFWSKVEGMTIHQKTTIDPTSSDKSKHPVSIIDLALSEGLIRKMSIGASRVPQTPASASQLEQLASPNDLAAIRNSTSPNVERDILLNLTLKNLIGPITGNTQRDHSVVKRLASADNNGFSDLLVTRSPNSFP